MAESPLIVIADEPSARAIEHSAKAVEKGLDVLAKTGGYVSEVLGDIPHNLAGIVGDRVRHARRMRAAELDESYTKKLADRGAEPEQPSLSVSVPLIEAAVDETRDGLKELWENLLANAMDPARSGRVRTDLIEVLKKLNPLDAAILKGLRNDPSANFGNKRQGFANMLQRNENEIVVSFDYLVELGLAARSSGERWNPYITEKGALLLDAVAD